MKSKYVIIYITSYYSLPVEQSCRHQKYGVENFSEIPTENDRQ